MDSILEEPLQGRVNPVGNAAATMGEGRAVGVGRKRWCLETQIFIVL